MPMSNNSSPSAQDMRVALLYQTSHLGGHLKDALKEFGANVVYEGPSADIDRDKLEGSGARVVIVNLDADSDAYIDQLYDVLDAGDYEVVFNDASVSSNLQGWDHARWARNLAAKILNKPDAATPPRPPGAEAVPTPVQKSASFVPVAEKPGDTGPLIRPPAAPAPKAASAPQPAAPPKQPQRVEPPTLELPTIDPVALAEAPTQELPTVDMSRHAQTADSDVGLNLDDLAEFARLAEPPPVPTQAAPKAAAKGSVDSDFAAELDALFASAGPAPGSDFDISLPDEPTTKPMAKAHDPFDLGTIELTDTDVPTQAAGAFEESIDMHSEFPALFDQLDDAADAVPAATDSSFRPAELPAAPAKAAASAPVLPPEWNLESDELPITGPAKFGIEKVAAEDYLAPKVEETARKVPIVPEKTSSGLTLELMPMEDAVAQQTYQNPNYSSEAWLDGSRPAQKLKVGTGTGVQRVFVLGASIGGPEAVREFLGALPKDFPVLFVLAQHMGEEFLELMSAQLAKSITLTVRNPTHGERVAHGEVVIVPTTHRVQIDAEGVITMAHLPEKSQYTPSIDQVLRDMADMFGEKAGTIIFSGMAHDAIEGSQYLKAKGGTVWVQDPDTCVISSMVDGAREAGVVSFMGSPQQLAEKMITEYGKG